MDPHDTDPGRIEAARLRYELSRLADRRTVRLALAVGEARRAGLAAAFAALRGRAPRLDVPGPSTTPRRPPLPQLRAVHTGGGYLLASTVAHDAVTPATASTTIRRDRPDLVVVDRVEGWSAGALTEVCAAAAAAGAAVVTVGPAAAAATPHVDLRVATEADVDDADLVVGPVVDARLWSPVGLDDAAPAHRAEDTAPLTPDTAHEQPVVVVGDVAATGPRRCLELLAAGALVVTGPDRRLASLLGDDADLVVGAADTLDERADALLGDDERRRRTSVRLRRRVHTHHTTRQAILAIAGALGIADPPSERISVLLACRRPERVGAVLADLAGQHHRDVEVLLLVHGDAAVPDLDRLVAAAGADTTAAGAPGGSGPTGSGVRVERVPADRPLGAVLNVGLDLATGAAVAKVDDDDRYGPNHLGDLQLALRYSGAELVGRRVHGVYLEASDRTLHPPPGGEECWENHLPGGTLMAPADVLRSVRWRHVPSAVDTELVRALHLAGGSAYSTHRYGYVRVRHGDHTYHPDVAFDGVAVEGLDTSLLDA